MSEDSEIETTIIEIIEAATEISKITFNQVLNELKNRYPEKDFDAKKESLRITVQELIAEKLEEINEQSTANLKEEQTETKEEKQEEEETSEAQKDDEAAEQKSEVTEKKAEKKKKKEGSVRRKKEEIETFGEDVRLQGLLLEAYKFGASGPRSSRAASKRRAPPVSQPAEKQEKEPKKRKSSGFAKMSSLSPALAKFLGEEQLPRNEVVKRMHEYFKQNNLQNPKNKRKIIFDEKLQEIFKCKTTDYFKLNKLISKHVKPLDQVV